MPPGTRPTFYGAFRESNALHLEILALAPLAGVPIEFDVYDRDSPATMLATLEAAREKRFNPMLGDYGAGSFVINRNEPKATEQHLRAGNFIKVRLGGVYRFVWVIEDVDWTELARDEKGAEDVKVTGKGAMARLNDATMWVESFLGDDPVGGKWDLGAAGTGNARGDMLRRALAEALARPDGSPIGWISLGWPYGADSQGAVWTDENELVADVGLELGRLWEQLTALGLESEMTPDYEIRTYQELGRHFEPPPTGNGSVTFLRGRHLLGDWHERRRDARKTRLIVKGADGVTLIVSDAALEAEIGRKEGSVSFSNTSDPDTLQRGGRATIESLKAEQQALELPMAHDALPGGLEPYVHYRPGDWVGLEQRDGTIAPHRVVGLRFEELPNSYALVVQLNSRRVEALVRLKRMIDALGGGSAGGGTAAGSAVSGGGSTGGGGVTGDGKVAAAAGDTLAYLYDQLEEGTGIRKELSGAGAAQGVELHAELELGQLLDVDMSPGPAEDDVPAWDNVAGLWVPRARGAGGGGGGAPSFLYSTKAAADTPDDEMTGALPGKWAVVAGAAAAVALLEAGNVARYDRATRAGAMLFQVGSAATQEVLLRQDYTIPDGRSIVAAIAPSLHFDVMTENELQIGLSLNSDDSNFNVGAAHAEFYAAEVDAATGPDIQWAAAGHAGGSAGFTLPIRMVGIGRFIFLRITRGGQWYYPSSSFDGHTWVPFGASQFAAAPNNLWLFARAAGATGTPVPIHAVAWVREGGNGIDPWPWA